MDVGRGRVLVIREGGDRATRQTELVVKSIQISNSRGERDGEEVQTSQPSWRGQVNSGEQKMSNTVKMVYTRIDYSFAIFKILLPLSAS